VGVTSQVVLGSEGQAEDALEGSEQSGTINTSFVGGDSVGHLLSGGLVGQSAFKPL